MSDAGSSWLVCEQARRRLVALEAKLLELASSASPGMHDASTHLVRRGGKRIRPALLFAAAALGEAGTNPTDNSATGENPAGINEADELSAAAAIELVHVASLYHDDVMDQATHRRGVSSANETWGNLVAVLAGTFLFSRAVEELTRLSAEVGAIASHSWAVVCAGQVHEMENAFNLELTVDEHLEILGQKTASLFQLPCRLGALLAGLEPALVDALAGYGLRLGLAFQLADDALDIAGDASELGKRTGIDILRGVYSLPVLETLAQDNADSRRVAAVLTMMKPTEHDLAEVLDIVRSGHGVQVTLGRAGAMAADAVAVIDVLPAGDVRTSLENLASFVVERTA